MTSPIGGGAPPPRALKVIAAFAAVYLIWGSTYLFIKWAVESLPPFLMAGARFLIAGAIMYSWGRLSGAARPSLESWRAATVVGALLLAGGNGCVVFAATRMPSGISALFIATTPLWMVGLDWARRGGKRPSAQVMAGLALGFGGLVLLMDPFRDAGRDSGGSGIDPLGALVLVLGTLSWSAGSIYSQRAPLPSSSILAVGMEQLAGGALLCLLGLLAGEAAAFDPARVTPRAVLSLAYLFTFGSIVAFTAYIWLLRVSTPARVSTYAYVNPLVAVFLGWALNGETLSPRMLLAAGVIVAGVAVMTHRR